MRKKVFAFLLVLVLLCSISPVSLASGTGADLPATVTIDPTRAQAIEKLQQVSDGDLTLDQDGVQIFLSGKLSGKQTVGSAAAIQFLSTYKSLFGIDDAAKELRKQKTIRGAAGDTVIRFDQLIDGIPVEGNALNVHFGRDGSIVSVNGNFLKDKTITALGAGTISQADAVETAKKQFTYDSLRDAPSAQRVILTKDGKNYDTYKVNISYQKPDIGNYDVYVEAHTGEVVDTESNIRYDGDATGTGVDVTGVTRDLNLRYDVASSSYLMKDFIRLTNGIQTFDCRHGTSVGYIVSSATNSFNSENYKASVSAHYFAGEVIDFYQQLFGRNSLDDGGMEIDSYTHYDYYYNNAYWDGYEMVYGDGDGSLFTYLSGDLDVVGHEMTHGVIDYTANLYYHNQSGALNESLADTFGVLIETYDKYNVGSGGAWAFNPADWVIGDEIYTPGTPGDALRSLKDPTLYGQPDNMADYMNMPDDEDNDNGGVHENSGIPNKAAYLIAQSIGMQKTASIYYTALNQYMGTYTDFAGAKGCLAQAAKDLYGAGSNEVSAVANAFQAVGVASSTNAKLASLTASSGALSPAFDATVLNYTLNVNTSTNSVTLSAPPQEPDAAVNINGTVRTSRSIPVQQGSDTPVTITVTALDGSTQQVYHVNIHPLPNGPRLSSITFDDGALSPAFDPDVHSYTLYIDNSMSSVNLTVGKQDPGATVKISGVAGTSLQIPFSYNGTNVTIEVTAANGIDKNTYTVTIYPFWSGVSAQDYRGNYVGNRGCSAGDVVVSLSPDLVITATATFNGADIDWPTDSRFTAEGRYTIQAIRTDGLTGIFQFAIDKTPPVITAKTASGATVANGAEVYNEVFATIAEDNVSSLTVSRDGYTIEWPEGGRFTYDDRSNSRTTYYSITVSDPVHNSVWFNFAVKKNICLVQFSSMGSSSVADVWAAPGTRISAPATPTFPGNTFGGWYTDIYYTHAWNFATDVVTADMTLYAKWTYKPCTVTFDTQGSGNIGPFIFSSDSTITMPPTPYRTGYTFGGWYRDAACTRPWNFNIDMVTDNMTLYARWVHNIYTITFDPQGGSAVASITVDSGAKLTKPATTRPGYTLNGWYHNAACTWAWNFDTDTVANDTTLYAGWGLQSPSTYLSGIALSAGGLNRAFNGYVTSYTVNLGENNPAVTITPAKTYDGAAMTIDGKKVSAKTVSLANGKTATVTIKVTWNRRTTTYKITVTRAKSTANTLAALTSSAGVWSQPFDPAVGSYTLTLPQNVGKTTLKATRASGLSTVSPASKAFTLKNGQTVKATFKVKAQSGATRTYTVTITRPKSTNANLASLKLNVKGMAPGFNPAVTDYAITLPAKTASVTITAKAADPLSKVTINGAKKAALAVKLISGQSTMVTVTVTAQSGDVKSYHITVSRK